MYITINYLNSDVQYELYKLQIRICLSRRSILYVINHFTQEMTNSLFKYYFIY